MNIKAAALPSFALLTAAACQAPADLDHGPAGESSRVTYGTVQVDGLDIFYREAGDPDAPAIVLLHGFPTSSHMFRELIPDLAEHYHVIAPDFPGFGESSAPDHSQYDYTFANLASAVEGVLDARGFDRYALYLMDYGAPVGYRLATAHPERVTGLVVQNGNAYEEGLEGFWDPIKAYWQSGATTERDALRGFLELDATKWQYQHGTRHPESISPDNWLVVQPLLNRPGVDEIQLDLFYDYRTNVALYPEWQQYLRSEQPPTLLTWGANDQIFPASGAHPYLRDLPNAELHLLDTGHFALEEDGDQIARLIKQFMSTRVEG